MLKLSFPNRILANWQHDLSYVCFMNCKLDRAGLTVSASTHRACCTSLEIEFFLLTLHRRVQIIGGAWGEWLVQLYDLAYWLQTCCSLMNHLCQGWVRLCLRCAAAKTYSGKMHRRRCASPRATPKLFGYNIACLDFREVVTSFCQTAQGNTPPWVDAP